jgi:uncharacterized protein YhaN
MRLHRIALRNYRGVVASEVQLPTSGVVIIEGDNEIGKTSLAEAVDLLLTYPDSSSHRRIKAIQPIGRDEGPEAEVELSSGPYRFVYRKRWCRQKLTTLDVLEPHRAQLTGKEAHDRVEAMLAETLDKPLWDALRLEQGTELTQAGLNVASLGRALDVAAGGDRAGDREDALWERICAERDRYFTPSGQVHRERAALAAQLESARARTLEAESLLRDLDDAADEVARLAVEAQALEVTRAEQERSESELDAQVQVVSRRRAEVRQLLAERDLAAVEGERWLGLGGRRNDQVDAVERAHATLTEQLAQVEQGQPARAAAEARRTTTHDALKLAREALQQAEHGHRLALDDADHRRRQIELEQLTERRDRVVEAQQRLSTAELDLEQARVDVDLVARIELAHLELAKAGAAAASGAASLTAHALQDLVLDIDGSPVTLTAGAAHDVAVPGSVAVSVPGMVRLEVRASAETQVLVERVESARRHLTELCDDGGVADLAGARAALAERDLAERTRTEALAVIVRDLRDLTLESLTQKIGRLTTRIADYAAGRATEPPLPVDLDEAQSLAADTEFAVRERHADLARAEADAEQAASALGQAAVVDAGLTAMVEQSRSTLAQAEQTLADARAELADDTITDGIAAASTALATAVERLAAAEAELRAADPDTLETLLQNARDAKARCVDALHHNRDRRRELAVKLELQGEQGLAQQLDDAKSELDHLTRDHERLEARALAAKLLHDTFAARRAESHQRYIAPFRERIEQLGRIVFGDTFEVELDDDLSIATRTLDHKTVAFDQLSVGTREQLGILSRLACASIVSADGGAPVIFDDALGWTDPGRLQRMGAAIASAGRSCQIIVLTCTPGRYASVGTATVIPLGA